MHPEPLCAAEIEDWTRAMGLVEDWLLHASLDTVTELGEFAHNPRAPRLIVDTLAEAIRRLTAIAEEAG